MIYRYNTGFNLVIEDFFGGYVGASQYGYAITDKYSTYAEAEQAALIAHERITQYHRERGSNDYPVLEKANC